MTNETFSLNNKFKDLLLCVEGDNVKRKELLNIAKERFGLTPKQAEGFVARNVRRLKLKRLLNASGNKGECTYHFSSTLKCLIRPTETVLADRQKKPESNEGSENLSREETKIQISLEMLLSELEAYRDIHERFPSTRPVVQGLLNEAKKESTQLYGRLNALKKVIQATNQRSTSKC